MAGINNLITRGGPGTIALVGQGGYGGGAYAGTPSTGDAQAGQNMGGPASNEGGDSPV